MSSFSCFLFIFFFLARRSNWVHTDVPALPRAVDYTCAASSASGRPYLGCTTVFGDVIALAGVTAVSDGSSFPTSTTESAGNGIGANSIAVRFRSGDFSTTDGPGPAATVSGASGGLKNGKGEGDRLGHLADNFSSHFPFLGYIIRAQVDDFLSHRCIFHPVLGTSSLGPLDAGDSRYRRRLRGRRPTARRFLQLLSLHKAEEAEGPEVTASTTAAANTTQRPRLSARVPPAAAAAAKGHARLACLTVPDTQRPQGKPPLRRPQATLASPRGS